MKHRQAQRALAVVAGVFFLVSNLCAQAPDTAGRVGLVQDWTQNHIVFSHDGLSKNPSLLSTEPRIANRLTQRWQRTVPGVGATASVYPGSHRKPKRDWNVSLGLGRVAANMFPAKFSFDPSAAPDCDNDYVVFGLNRLGSATQANLLALNNLYSGAGGFCASPTPTFLFAYNISTLTAGRILDSPALSLDGTKIAFVESGNIAGNNMAIFHVLTWATGAGNGTSGTAAAVPGVGNTASMTSLTFAARLDTRSSPWVDYATDTAYVGADDGNLYKITGVFHGTPTLAGGNWPVTLAPNVRVSSPVFDNRLGRVLVGIQNGTYYSVDTTGNPLTIKSLVVGTSGGPNPGILAAPVVDVTDGTSFVVSANDGTSGVLVEVNHATMTQLAKGRIGQASTGGTAISLFQPALDDAYFNDPTTGTIRVCGTGTTDNSPWQYAFGGFTQVGGKYVMNTTPTDSSQIVTSPNARCTPFTEFFNPNVGPGGTDFFFFGLTTECSGAGTSGCVVARNQDGSLSRADITGGPSGIVVDNFSAEGQASSIYFGGVGVTTPNLAFKFTQSGLQ